MTLADFDILTSDDDLLMSASLPTGGQWTPALVALPPQESDTSVSLTDLLKRYGDPPQSATDFVKGAASGFVKPFVELKDTAVALGSDAAWLVKHPLRGRIDAMAVENVFDSLMTHSNAQLR